MPRLLQLLRTVLERVAAAWRRRRSPSLTETPDTGPKVQLPANGWRPRPYQLKLWRFLEHGGKRGVAIWHRRAGKDELCLHWTATAAFQRVGVYWHMLPQASQARKAIWNAVNPHTGRRRIDDAFPLELRKRTLEQEMFIEFINGSTWQVIGSDNYDSFVGSPPIGVIFSEYALADPRGWSYVRPILAENGGWALFITTPRGRNHAAKLYDSAKLDPDQWFAERLSALDTGVFTADDLERELRELKRENGDEDGESLYQQEYLSDFSAAIRGAYYGKLMDAADAEGRIGDVPLDPGARVETWWDLGMRDSTAIWFVQRCGLTLRAVDYYEASGVGLDHYAAVLQAKQAERKWTYGQHIAPHDIRVKELGTGKSREEIAGGLGIAFTIAPKLPVIDGINAGRRLIAQTWFDAVRCERGIDALRNYRREWSVENRAYRNNPLHDWTSHGADAWRTGATGPLPTSSRANPKTIPYPDQGIA